MAQTPDSPRWADRVKTNWLYAIHILGTLFMTAVGAGAAYAFATGNRAPVSYTIASSVPACAAILFFVIFLIFPDIFDGASLRMPHPFTLPTLFTLIVVLVRSLMYASSLADLVLKDDIPRLDVIWSNPKFLLAVWAAQVTMLIFILMTQRKPRGKPE